MRKVLAVILIFGFLFVDFLFFHDLLKPGEVTTLPQYLTGALSIPVMLYATRELPRRRARQHRV
jgi:multisubunit Na+/H+ antiporter MnhB subunit